MILGLLLLVAEAFKIVGPPEVPAARLAGQLVVRIEQKHELHFRVLGLHEVNQLVHLRVAQRAAEGVLAALLEDAVEGRLELRQRHGQ